MYIKEYLQYVCGIYKITDTQKQIKNLIDQTGLGIEQHKKIGALSKGYRQRVGLAQALIHNPDVLILDEPTTGLDPNQIVEIRNLIKEVGKEKTVMLSTHIMQEVKAICDRVIIINKGQIVADEKADAIQRKGEAQQVVKVEFDKPISLSKLKEIPGVLKVNENKPGFYNVYSGGKSDIRPLIFKMAVENGLTVLSQTLEEQSLEDVFRKLTK
jgi:ABC-2 type transport system ATP-binding protein